VRKGKVRHLYNFYLIYFGVATAVFSLPLNILGRGSTYPGGAREAAVITNQLGMLTSFTRNQWTVLALIPTVAICLTPNSVTHLPLLADLAISLYLPPPPMR
jgi:hypothetical protein